MSKRLAVSEDLIPLADFVPFLSIGPSGLFSCDERFRTAALGVLPNTEVGVARCLLDTTFIG